MPRLRYPCVRDLLKPMLDALAHQAHKRKADIDARYAGLGVSPATVRAWKNGNAKPHDETIIGALARDAVTVLGKDRAWCEALFACLDAPPALQAGIIEPLFGSSPAALPDAGASGIPADRIPFLAPPLSPHKMIGREKDLRDVARRLTAGNALSLTALRGLPGVGKTTLAVALAHQTEVLRLFPDGVLWIGLGRQPEVDDGLRRWAAVLGLDSAQFERLATRKARMEAVHDRIGLRRMLLVIDDAWQPADALAFRIGGPNCSHLLTTRSPAIAHDFAGNSVLFVHELMPGDGARLIRSLAPELPTDERSHVRELVVRVGALPLALSLVGRQLWKLAHAGEARPVQALLGALNDAHARMALAQPFSLFDRPAGQTDAAGQVSLGAVIRVSYEALDDAAQRAFAALAVLPPKPGTFSREAASAVAACDDATIQRLCDAGLLDAAGEDGRLTLHQTVSDFAATQLDTLDDATAAARRFAEWGFHAARDNTQAPAVIEREMPVLRGAMARARALGMPEFALTVNYLYRYFAARGQFALAEPLFRDALAQSHAIGHDLGVAWSAMNVGNIVFRLRNDFAEAERMLSEAVDVFRVVGDDEKLSDALAAHAEYLGLLKRYADAEVRLREAIEIGHRIGDLSLVAQGLTHMGVLMWQRGEDDRAIEFYQQSLAAARAGGYASGEATALENLGRRYKDKGRFAEARAAFAASLEVATRLGLIGRACAQLLLLADLDILQNDADGARDNFERVIRLATRHQADAHLRSAHARFGRFLRERGELRAAREHLAKACELDERVGHEEALASDGFELAKVLAELGETHEATEHGRRSLAAHRRLGNPLADEVKAWLGTAGLIDAL